eukprot:12534207-Alexandrium_andersonii.AAC.1
MPGQEQECIASRAREVLLARTDVVAVTFRPPCWGEKWQARRARAPRDGAQAGYRAPRVVAEPSVPQAAPA